jgi:hypothetical protein
MSEMLTAAPADLARRDVYEEWLYPGDGATWRLVDGDYYNVSNDEDDHDAEEDAAASTLLLPRILARFNPLHDHGSSQGLVERPQRRPTERARARTHRPATRSQVTADPTRASEPAPAPSATVAGSAPDLAGQPPREASGLAPPQASSERGAPMIREGDSSQALGPYRSGRSSSASRRSARSGPTPPLDPRLRPFAHALADLLFADLLKYPPKP